MNEVEIVPETDVPEEKMPPDRWKGVFGALREIGETVVLTLLIFLVIRTVIQNFRIEGSSMEPNFHHGQYLIINKFEYYFHDPNRGDIVVFRFPQNPKRDFIKRVIALPGEKVEIKEGTVFINDWPLYEDYNPIPPSYTWGPKVVGENDYFVLGDNRNNSSDSHSWGMLPRNRIVGKAWISYWPPQYWGILNTPSFAAGP